MKRNYCPQFCQRSCFVFKQLLFFIPQKDLQHSESINQSISFISNSRTNPETRIHVPYPVFPDPWFLVHDHLKITDSGDNDSWTWASKLPGKTLMRCSCWCWQCWRQWWRNDDSDDVDNVDEGDGDIDDEEDDDPGVWSTHWEAFGRHLGRQPLGGTSQVFHHCHHHHNHHLMPYGR